MVKINDLTRNAIHLAVPTVPELSTYEAETANEKCKRKQPPSVNKISPEEDPKKR